MNSPTLKPKLPKKSKNKLLITDLEKDENLSSDKNEPNEVMEKENLVLSEAGETRSTLRATKATKLSSAQYMKSHLNDFHKTREDFLAYIINDL